uniref:RRM domain-containing protein n=1 Tax=Salix viminalis TaxID=40686 RepID=A0A6N2MCB3_SALVM
MGAKAKKSLKKEMSKISSSPSTQLVNGKQAAADFLPLEGGPARKLPELKELKNKSGVLYIGRIPHGFYEDEMKAYFSQFGTIKRLRIARNKKTGKSKHFGFMTFDDSEVAEVVAECMHNYLLFEHLLQVHVIPQEHVHPKLWKGFNYRYNPLNRLQTERKLHNKERTLDEHRRLVVRIMKQDQKRRKKIEAAGLDYECPEFRKSAFAPCTSSVDAYSLYPARFFVKKKRKEGDCLQRVYMPS